MSSSAPAQFSLIDYLVLSIVLLISSAIGLYYRLVNRHCQVYFTSVKKEKENIIMRRNLRLSGGRQKTSSEYLLADGAMGVIKMPTSQLNICLLHFLIWSTPNSQSSHRLPQLPSLWWPHSCPLSLFLGWPRRTTHTEHRFLGIQCHCLLSLHCLWWSDIHTNFSVCCHQPCLRGGHPSSNSHILAGLLQAARC